MLDIVVLFSLYSHKKCVENKREMEEYYFEWRAMNW